MAWWKRDEWFLWSGIIIIIIISAASQLLFLHVESSSKTNHTRSSRNQEAILSPPVTLLVDDQHVVMDNGIVTITLQNPTGHLTGIKYNGVGNLLNYHHVEGQRGYWDIVWSRPGDPRPSQFDTLQGTKFTVIAQGEDKIEISFSKTWNPSTEINGLPLNFDKRFILLRGNSGFYSYAVFEHPAGWPAVNIDETRIAFNLEYALFSYMAISDDKQRVMPSAHDFETGEVLDYAEARLLTHPDNPALTGQVDDKYEYSCDNKDNLVHGWISSVPHMGFWVITPSDEFRTGGPVKRDLTSHTGPVALSVFFSNHYAGPDMRVDIQDKEPWKKVFGPVFIYMNSDSQNEPLTLWNDAKRQMEVEKKSWPYDFPVSVDFPYADQRGAVTGHLMVRDRYISSDPVPAKFAYVGLAPPGDLGSWQRDSKGYQFWTRTDENGFFKIKNVRPGAYNLHAWIPGVLGDYKYDVVIEIIPGSQIGLQDLIYDPPRNGPTIWEIGIPDRTAAEFFVPDGVPGRINPLYNNHPEKFRQYGLWARYTDLYPIEDLIFTIGESDYHKDWFFAHVNRRGENNKYVPTTWQIRFDLINVNTKGTYIVRIALASATFAHLEVRINDPKRARPQFATGDIGRDNAIARHGIHGLYYLYSFGVPGYQLVNGRNTMFIYLFCGGNQFNGVMYDYLRLEGPP